MTPEQALIDVTNRINKDLNSLNKFTDLVLSQKSQDETNEALQVLKTFIQRANEKDSNQKPEETAEPSPPDQADVK
jgi:hypothetical protein